MSTLANNDERGTPASTRDAGSASAPPKVPTSGKRSRQRHTPGGAALGQDAGPEAQRLAAAILDVLAGVRTPAEAAAALGLSQPRYFQIEARRCRRWWTAASRGRTVGHATRTRNWPACGVSCNGYNKR